MHRWLRKIWRFLLWYRSVGQRLYNTTLHIMLGNILVTKREQRYVNFYFFLSLDNALLSGNLLWCTSAITMFVSSSKIKQQLAFTMSFQLWSYFIIVYNLQLQIYSWENRNHKYQTKNHFNRTNIKMFCIFAVKWK